MSSNSSSNGESKKSIEPNKHKTISLYRLMNRKIIIIISSIIFLFVIWNIFPRFFIHFYYFEDHLIVITVSLIISVAFVMGRIIVLSTKEQSSPKQSVLENAYNLLIKEYKKKTLDEDTIFSIYNREIVSSDGSTEMSLIDFLESFQIYVMNTDNEGELTKDIKILAKPILDREKEQKPYPNLNETERNILIEIENCIKRGENDSIKNRLGDLSLLIQKNYNALKKAEKTNKWSISGILLTAGFGLWSIFGFHMSKDEIEQISQKVSQQVLQQNTKQNCTLVFDSIDCVKPKDSIK